MHQRQIAASGDLAVARMQLAEAVGLPLTDPVVPVRPVPRPAPADGDALVRGWCVSEELWLRRLAILSQLGRRERTDLRLLTDALEPNLRDGEFFIRKAIGWALRDAARAYPEWVSAYVAAHALSPLSRREALKHL